MTRYGKGMRGCCDSLNVAGTPHIHGCENSDPMTTTQAPEGRASMLAGLDTMRRVVAHWVEYDTLIRAGEGLSTGPETYLVAPPHWPSHGALAAWVETLKQAHEALSVPVNGEGLGSLRPSDCVPTALGDPAVLASVLRARGKRNSLHDIDRATAFLAQIPHLTEALEFYASDHKVPNDGPWGISSSDFGSVARGALRRLRGLGG